MLKKKLSSTEEGDEGAGGGRPRGRIGVQQVVMSQRSTSFPWETNAGGGPCSSGWRQRFAWEEASAVRPIAMQKPGAEVAPGASGLEGRIQMGKVL